MSASLNFLACWLCFHCALFSEGMEFSVDSVTSARYSSYEKHGFRYLEVPTHAVTRVREFVDCAMKCLMSFPTCLSLNMASAVDDEGMFWCELLLADMYNNSQSFKDNSSSHHFSLWTPCLKKPCQNGGFCVPSYHDDTHKCLCETGFTGGNCETNIDNCASSPCANGGTCTDGVNDFTCTCAAGFQGKTCLLSCNTNDGWKDFIDHCYKYIQDSKTWQNSKANCDTLGSFLVTIHSNEERDFALSVIPAGVSNVWMGGSDIATEGVWAWEDGKPWGVYTAWKSGEPNNANSNEHCLEMYGDGLWNDVACTSAFPSICQKGCNLNDGWKMFNSHCYKFFQTQKTWSDAKTYCSNLGAYLVTTHSQAERDFALSVMPADGANFWIGGNDMATDGVWVWEDGKPWGAYTAWNSGEPNGGNNEQCIVMFGHSSQNVGRWNDAPCGHLKPFMCKK